MAKEDPKPLQVDEDRPTEEPRISVVVPMRDAVATLGAQFAALANQSYEGAWELIVADNGSTDGSRQLAEEWLGRIPGMKIVDASDRRGPSSARNAGAAAAKGRLLAFCDTDDVVDQGWLDALIAALETHDFVVGSMDDTSLNRGLPASWFDLRSHPTDPTATSNFLPYARSCNLAITREAFLAVGGFDDELTHGEDKDFSWRVQAAGYALHFAPDAVVSYRRRRNAKSIWRQYVGFGRSDVLLYRRFREAGLPRSSWMKALRAYATLIVTAPKLLVHQRRGPWVRAAAIRWGRIVCSIRERTLYL